MRDKPKFTTRPRGILYPHNQGDPKLRDPHMHQSFSKCQAILETKSMDYNGMTDAECDPARTVYFPFGDASYLHMIHTKFERIKMTHMSQTNHESTLDSVYDMINYLAFYAAWLERNGGDNGEVC